MATRPTRRSTAATFMLDLRRRKAAWMYVFFSTAKTKRNARKEVRSVTTMKDSTRLDERGSFVDGKEKGCVVNIGQERGKDGKGKRERSENAPLTR